MEDEEHSAVGCSAAWRPSFSRRSTWKGASQVFAVGRLKSSASGTRDSDPIDAVRARGVHVTTCGSMRRI